MKNKNLIIIILLLIAIVILGIAFYKYATRSYQIDTPEENTQVDKNEITYPTVTPKEVVSAFLGWYLSDDNSLPSDKYKEASVLTEKLKEQISSIVKTPNNTIDPFTCSKNNIKSEQLEVNSTRIIDRSAEVVVNNIAEGEENSFIYELVLTEDGWKINNILCFLKG